MIPGELVAAAGELELNAGRETRALRVMNTGDRPIQVGSHFEFASVNAALSFDRSAARGLPARHSGGDVGALRAGGGAGRRPGRLGGARIVRGLSL